MGRHEPPVVISCFHSADICKGHASHIRNDFSSWSSYGNSCAADDRAGRRSALQQGSAGVESRSLVRVVGEQDLVEPDHFDLHPGLGTPAFDDR